MFYYNLGVAPFPGATTGTGGRIRDVQAAGIGSNVVAGTAGYCFGNLNIPGNYIAGMVPLTQLSFSIDDLVTNSWLIMAKCKERY